MGLDARFSAAWFHPVPTPHIPPTPPKSWKDLWDPGYKGKLIIPDINAIGIWEMLIISARLHGGDEGNMDPSFAGLRALKPNVRKFYKSSVDLQQLLEAGEAGIAAVTPAVQSRLRHGR